MREAAVAVTHTDAGEAELTAFVVPEAGALAEDAVRARLLQALPRNMVPARFVGVPAIPLSPHGKVDRAALVDTLKNRGQ
ncbi:AMP-binding enzyme [Streptomyces sp. NPDC005070]